MEAAEEQIDSQIATVQSQILGQLPIGARLILRCRKDWREAVVSQFYEDKAILTVVSASGKTYRVRRQIDLPLVFEGKIPILTDHCEELEWRENLVKYDSRW